MFYQDRLGTNTGKPPQKDRVSSGSWAAIFLTPALLQLLTTANYCVSATDEDYRTYYARRQTRGGTMTRDDK